MSNSRTKTFWLALGVHVLTGSGALCALFSLLAIFDGDARLSLLWLLIALVVDGIDGPMARRLKVREEVPFIDGVILDLIVDFLTYVFVPVVFIWHFDLFPKGLELVLFVGIFYSSLYLFCFTEMKESDNFFNGFPAAWNLVLIVWFILGTSPLLNAVMTVIFCILTFVPIKSVHPIRVDRFHQINLAMVVGWVGLSAVLVALRHEGEDGGPLVFTLLWGVSTVYFVVISLWRTVKGRDAWKRAARGEE